LERLWAPWRARYVTGAIDADPGCIFCQKLNDTRDAANYVLVRTERCFVLLNLYPYNNGHLLVAPKRHVADITDLTGAEMQELMEVTAWMVRLERRAMRPHGFNVGVNLGRVAGAGIPGHFHIHIVPRWDGDTSFMPVLGEVKVISEALEDTYAKLKRAVQEDVGEEKEHD